MSKEIKQANMRKKSNINIIGIFEANVIKSFLISFSPKIPLSSSFLGVCCHNNHIQNL